MKKYFALVLIAVLLCQILPSAFADDAEDFQKIIGEDTVSEAENTDEIMIADVPYLDDGNEDHLMDLFGVEQAKEPTPLVVEVHGGGYIGGNKSINTDHSLFYEENGYLVVAPNYTHLPTGTFKTALQDLFACYNWVAEHAEEYHFDLDRVALSGDSAGGYYVLLTAAVMNSEELQTWFEVTKPAFDFCAYVASCPGTDVMDIRNGFGQSGPAGYMAGKIGEEILMDDELMNHCDLYSIVDGGTYPFIYMVTTPGDVTTGSETLKYDAFLTELGVAHELHSYEDEGSGLVHVFNITKMAYPESIKANEDIVAYLNSICF